MTPDDIKFYHSGGNGNCDPDKDLGGPRSTCELQGGVETLFDDISPVKSRCGLVDYRCFYIKNTHEDETLRDCKVYIDSERGSGSFVDLGVKLRDEVQTVNISGPKPPEEGQHMVLNLPTYGSFKVYYHVNKTIWQGRFQTEIRGLDGLSDVRVSIAGIIGFPTNITFTVRFVGKARSRDLQPMSVASHDLDQQTITVATTTDGSPINTEACTIATKYQAPTCADFDYYLRGNPIRLGDLRPGEEFPLWVRRTTPKDTLIFLLDNFRINVDGTFP